MDRSPAESFLLDGFPRVVSDGFPFAHDQLFALSENVSEPRQLLRLNIVGGDSSTFERQTAPLVRFFDSLGRLTTVDLDENDIDASYQEIREVANTFLVAGNGLVYEKKRFEEEEAEEEARQKAAEDAKAIGGG